MFELQTAHLLVFPIATYLSDNSLERLSMIVHPLIELLERIDHLKLQCGIAMFFTEVEGEAKDARQEETESGFVAK